MVRHNKMLMQEKNNEIGERLKANEEKPIEYVRN